MTEFADLPQKGQYIIYDLGQERIVNKLAMYCQDSAVNYIRDADILISNEIQMQDIKHLAHIQTKYM